MDLSLTGRHALVCGASKGIGRATAAELARNGASITAVARSERLLASLIKELEKDDGQTHSYLVLDFNKPENVEASITAHCLQLPVHVLVNNSGGPPAGPAYSASTEAYQRAFAQHVLCNQLVTASVLPGMRAAGYGRIINIISTSVKQPIDGLGVSNTIRGAVANWAKTLANELGPDGITVNNVLPGFTGTSRLESLIKEWAVGRQTTPEKLAALMRQQVPLRRFADPSETANAIAFLASPAAAYINGINLPVDGGRLSSL